jgi:hypothetical protein
MSATPADIAKLTTNGIVVTTDATAGNTVKANHPEARDLGDTEIEMFFVDANHAQLLLNEKFAYLSQTKPLHEAVEVEERVGLGVTIPIAPTVPSFRVIDDSRNIDLVARTRAYAHDLGTDRFSVELLK